jgi:DNA polymerase III delta prime subunit
MIREYYGFQKTQNFPEHNILFIHSLKEQGIQYFRTEMKTFCQSRCTIHGKKKMIICDDLDTVNEQCQQVFRNYIDKYKNNIHFIGTCTNIQKVIESIQSRMHLLKMETMGRPEISRLMQHIILEERLSLTTEAQDYILHFSNGCVRQMMNHLEKIAILEDADTDPLSLETCKQLCSNISFQLFEEYLRHLRAGQTADAIAILYRIHDYGYSVIDILDYFFAFIKSTALLTEDEKYRCVPLLCEYITYFHSIHENVLELALVTGDLYRDVFTPMNI